MKREIGTGGFNDAAAMVMAFKYKMNLFFWKPFGLKESNWDYNREGYSL